MDPFSAHDRTIVGIGLGGICEGWIHQLLLLHQTGIIPAALILLVDGKEFQPHSKERQQVGQLRNKAEDRHDTWLGMFPEVPIRFVAQFVTPGNIGQLVADGSIVLLSPDNHHTRKLVSDHVETLHDVLLISAGNDAIDEASGTDGTEAMALVHYKREGVDLTPPITRHHPTIASPTDDSPANMGCHELVHAGHPQLLATNLLAGHLMIQLLYRYCSLPAQEAVQIVELWGNAKSGEVTPYGLTSRPLL